MSGIFIFILPVFNCLYVFLFEFREAEKRPSLNENPRNAIVAHANPILPMFVFWLFSLPGGSQVARIVVAVVNTEQAALACACAVLLQQQAQDVDVVNYTNKTMQGRKSQFIKRATI